MTAVCPTFAANTGSGGPIRRTSGWGLTLCRLANPRWFAEDPALAWGFYGHRMELYRQTAPHAGFAILGAGPSQMRRGGFVFTSNVDGQFQRAGFAPEQIVEVHGSFDGMQCIANCGVGDLSGRRGRGRDRSGDDAGGQRLPYAPDAAPLARPNILMFGDFGWESTRTDAQMRRMGSWLSHSTARSWS